LTFPNGLILQGSFKVGLPVGKGLIQFPNGKVDSGTWLDGKFSNSSEDGLYEDVFEKVKKIIEKF